MLLSQGAFKENCFGKLPDEFHYTLFLENLLKHCIFANLLLMKCNVQGAIRREPLAASFLDPQNNYFEKVELQIFINSSNKMPKHCIFAEFLLIVG